METSLLEPLIIDQAHIQFCWSNSLLFKISSNIQLYKTVIILTSTTMN